MPITLSHGECTNSHTAVEIGIKAVQKILHKVILLLLFLLLLFPSPSPLPLLSPPSSWWWWLLSSSLSKLLLLLLLLPLSLSLLPLLSSLLCRDVHL